MRKGTLTEDPKTPGLLPLLMVGLVLPLASELAIAAGQRAGLFGAVSAEMLHVLVMSTAFTTIVLVQSSSLRRLDASRREAMRQLRDREARLQQQLDRMPTACFTVSRELIVTSWNRAAERIFGYRPDEIIGQPCLRLLPHGHDQRLTKRLDRLWAGDADVHGVNENLTKDGRIILCRWTNTALCDDDGVLAGVLSMAEDVSEERRVREALTQTEARHHQDITQLRVAEAAANRLLNAVEQLDETVFMTDRDGTINYVNPAFVRLYGYSREEVIGCTPRILKSGEFTREQNAALWAELLSGRSIRAEYNNRSKSGSIVPVVSTASPIVEPDGAIQGFIAVQSDLREPKRLQEEHGRLEERMTHLAKMESLGTLAGGMAHDFNNILSIILTHASLLQKRRDDHAVVDRVTNTIQQAVKRGASLTRQILTFARRADTKLEDVALPKIIMELASMIGETFPRTIDVTLDIDPDLPLVRADAGQIHQALLNLCVNARDAMPDGGNLTIAASWTSAASMKEALLPDASEQKYIVISVSDTGIGIDDQTRARLFEPFFTTKEKGKGTGLGLAVVFGVAQNHGGMVAVDSRLGEGTTFRLYLPLVQPSAQPAVDGDAVVAGGTETLLVIEDEPALRDSVSSHLRAHGYHVTTASDGVDALAQLRARTGDLPAAVLMDLGMPRLSAADLVRGVREVAPQMQIMAMTGYVDPDIHASVVSAGVRSIVQKPFTIDELLTALRAVLN